VEGKVCCVSGAGNVAIYTVEKLLDVGAKVVTMSDSGGFVHDPNGITHSKLEYIIDLKTNRRGRIEEYANEFKCKFYPGKKPWGTPCDMAFPCATQNEIDEQDALTLVKNGCTAVVEGANMPATYEATNVFKEGKILYGPSKAANAGGVAISGLEMTQNAMHLSWSREVVNQKLKGIMKKIHEQCVEHGQSKNFIDYKKGANIAAFIKVSDAMMAYGVV
jgi:glutamate dehydrogenase (NADP+)